MTKVLKILTEYCAQYVDDLNLMELVSDNPPLFARRMYNYFPAAIAKFKMPPEMQEYLLGTKSNPKFIESQYSDYQFTANEDIVQDYIISLGEDYLGFELFSAHIRVSDAVGNVSFVPTSASYNAETATITIPATAENPIKAGTVFDFDFYTDGYFTEDLSVEIMDILGMCFQVVWHNRFSEDWLSMVSKVEDKSFSEQNRANKINADTARLRELRTQLNAAMRQYAENQYYKKIVPLSRRLNNL